MNEFVKESLPTIWSQRVAALTLSIASASVFLPESLQKLGLSTEGIKTLSFRLCVVTTILFLGTLLTLSLVVRAFNDYKKKALDNTPQNKANESLGVELTVDKPKEDILVLLSSSLSMTEDQLVNRLGVSNQFLKYHLLELFNSRYITNTIFFSGEPTKWSIDQKGRSHLVNLSLLK